MAGPGNQRKAGLNFAWAYARVTGVTGDQVIKATPALLHRLQISNADAAIQTVTIKDGAATLNVIRVPPGASFQPELFVKTLTSLIINPSNANLDVLVVYD